MVWNLEQIYVYNSNGRLNGDLGGHLYSAVELSLRGQNSYCVTARYQRMFLIALPLNWATCSSFWSLCCIVRCSRSHWEGAFWIRCPCTVNTLRNQSLPVPSCLKTPSCFQFPSEWWTFDSFHTHTEKENPFCRSPMQYVWACRAADMCTSF